MKTVEINGQEIGLTDGKYFYTRTASQVYLIREKDGKTQVLLQLRSGKVGAGTWDASSAGHCEQCESFTAAGQREAKEEIGIEFERKDIIFMTIIHHGSYHGENSCWHQFVNAHFFIENWQGEPSVCESDKCKDLKWFNINNLPEKMFADRREAISNFLNKISYSEIKWKNHTN